ncbi:hypothetical protein [Pediococcus ethanolidurans]|uniref:Uncharacterized protein n=1 Tax=Pediococcus ethanolidurans TaxID=319653 RepID=A0A0R2JWW6_9LACO|nr:hypothetical protein [Pediococcus ethanolidurans]KRN81571.1 hypothetical protein IV87_GL001084 [Pediococcus ethanolidurans]MBU7555121.1 hypothetical protein [Pediococcus ethanolidurans]MCV3315788.1 hypothetical protein [Pediococcus ethanolidurans]MCV3321652.1 hypothetical protein [Pediococcus ethanolidurans]MCV3324002.1 hypothetical protein [Pediococcus ethanolidurans]
MSAKHYQRQIAIAILILVIGIIRPFPVQLFNTLCLILGAALIGLTIVMGRNRK